MSCLRSKPMLRQAKSNRAHLHLSPGLSIPTCFSNWPFTAISLEVNYQSNVSRILATALSIFILFHVISVIIWSGVNSPSFNLRYSSQAFQSLEGSEDPGWTLMFLNECHGHVVAPPLFDN